MAKEGEGRMDTYRVVARLLIIVCVGLFFILLHDFYMMNKQDILYNRLYDSLNCNISQLKDKITHLEAVTPLKQLTTQIERLRSENSVLANKLSAVTAKVRLLAKENESLRARPAAVADSKVQQLPRSCSSGLRTEYVVPADVMPIPPQNLQQKRIKVQIDRDTTGGSNKGYLIKDGKSTSSAPATEK